MFLSYKFGDPFYEPSCGGVYIIEAENESVRNILQTLTLLSCGITNVIIYRILQRLTRDPMEYCNNYNASLEPKPKQNKLKIKWDFDLFLFFIIHLWLPELSITSLSGFQKVQTWKHCLLNWSAIANQKNLES